jgi:hypothetical protein
MSMPATRALVTFDGLVHPSGHGRSSALFDSAYREHALRLARAIIQRQGAGDQQEV